MNYDDSAKGFIEGELKRLKYVKRDIEKRGIDALGDYDKPKGVQWALGKIEEDIKYFETRLKEVQNG